MFSMLIDFIGQKYLDIAMDEYVLQIRICINFELKRALL
jgi:hypothetical protein